ncbi:hypothetical protein L202_06924 [Cryptococcus amylolentus CBS 6039]|uniref:Conidiation protein 6 n=2 Tax=Cryptococcus amylolentus TaxID=104669 RepID=A0A1E3HDZ2_9TREE|nr:hypothetical protein L202_06924 [Cryptococcus amylolentus CBS 6039]ODN74557.1 hypothetical protein L202_06924 [Cryptococcus amylolentus CBS 6039]ODO01528.1 hypothetical protein I350_06348 [Cryptococcus amylolentus CBS 6273]
MSDSAHQNHVIGGYKATLNNPNVSDEAKSRANEVIENFQENGSSAIEQSDQDNGNVSSADHHENQVLGGYKATLNNPNVSEDAKQHARDVLDQ